MPNLLSLKLRIYPNESQVRLIESYFRARQFAYHLGIELYKKDWQEYGIFKSKGLTVLKVDKTAEKGKLQTPRYLPKWKGQSEMSKRLTELKKEIETYNERLLELVDGENGEKHPLTYLLDIPRCIFTQALIDYGKCLSKAFADIKTGLVFGKDLAFRSFTRSSSEKPFATRLTVLQPIKNI